MTEPTNTLTQPGEFDALVKLRPDEPYFMLLGRDRLAPDLVCDWADQNRRKALRERHEGVISDEKLDAELRQSTEAEKVSWAMKAYKDGATEAETVGQGSLSYTGHEPTADASKRDRLQRARSLAVSALHNAIAEVNDLAELCRREADGDDHVAYLGVTAGEAVEDMRERVEAILPQRPAVKAVAA